MNPPTLTEINALLAATVGDLKPFELALIADALNRRSNWLAEGSPVDNFAGQRTLSAIVAEWSS